LWGFEPIVRWLREEGVPYRTALRDRACQLCVELVRDRRLWQVADRRAGAMDHRVRVAFGLLREFDEPWMDQLLRAEAAELLTPVAV
jgi:hypothetical protein